MKECCDEPSPEDGRRTDGEFHGGKWGPHKTNDQLDELTDKFKPIGKVVYNTTIRKTIA